ncbi:MAG: sulfatase-like hydrolase/transferase [Halanaerobiaceae bacterium]
MSKNKPNILLITTDQQRFDTINALGNDSIYTPHLNWLVDQGITFTNCYTDSPVCMAARATIMTGKNGYSTGLVGNSREVKPMKENETLPGILTRNGYQTRAQGKMHFEPMRAHYGFEYMELPMEYYRKHKKNPELGRPKEHGVGENEIEPVISTVKEENSLTHWTVERSIDFLETRDPTRPFFLWTSFTKPHPPYDPAFNYWNLYQNKDLPEPVYGDWSENVEDIPQGYLKSTYTLNNAYRLSKDQLKDCKRAYYACITQIDYTLGLLFARMREMDLLENTWIIFTSDHGDLMGDHQMAAKSVFLEGSAHIPLIVRPPFGSWEHHELEGKKCEAPVNLADIMPTVLDIVGIEGPDNIEGMNLLNQLDNPDHGRILYGNCGDEYFMVLEDNYKYMWTTLGGDELLFNLKEDPEEKNNLVEKENEKLEELRKKLIEHLKEYQPSLVENGELVSGKAPEGPEDVNKWPGFHSKQVPTDVLH